jgi:glutamyl-tRNA synthetase
MDVTRLAPSPTGALHLGNARTFLINWLLARQNNWRIILRIEDLDGPRIKRGADQQAIQDLRWLGIDWDDGPVYQSARTDTYRSAVARLVSSKSAYPCICTRREASLAASAPHAEDGASVYPGTCRDRFESIEAARRDAGREPAIRFRVPSGPIEFVDRFRGPVRFDDVATQLGDFVIAKSDGTAAYQLAVVVDDAEIGATQVVRGDDLIDSTPRQMLLYQALGLGNQVPSYTHLPLLVGPDGKRLAKRHGDTRLAWYRQAGVSAGRVRALLARWCGIECDDDVSVDLLLKCIDLRQLPRDPVTMSPRDDQWLRASVPSPSGRGSG